MNLTGRLLKQYHLTAELGAGGMGVVYRARDTVLGRDAAIKVLPADALQREDARDRFLREARAASALNHPNVITVYEVGCVDGIDFIAMEYVAGQTLQQLLRQRRLGVSESVGFALQAADALAKAHSAGVVHRDLKPSNLMITDDGLVKVLDFGLARLIDASRAMLDENASTVAAAFATRAGIVLGTLAYMSPEQARGAEAGAQSDIFSLGVVLFEMLSGQLPFAGDSDLARLHNLHVAQPKDLRSLSPDVPPELAEMVARMLAKDLALRYASMADVRRDLRAFSATAASTSAPLPVQSEPSSAPVTAATEPRRRTRQRALAMLAALIALAGAGGVAWIALSGLGSGGIDSLSTANADSIDTATATPYELYARARTLLDRFDREGNSVQAIRLLEVAVEKDNTFALGYATLTEAYRHRHRHAPDAQWVKLMSQSAARALELNPELGAAHIAMGLVAMEFPDRAVEAERHFARAIELDPKNPAPLLWSAVFFGATRRPEQASKYVQQALALAPTNWAALQELGLIHYRAADYQGAVAAWEQARTASPDNVRVLANLAAAYHMVDRYEDAASTLQRAIEIEPAAQHYANLGTLRFFQGRYEDAITPLEKAVEIAANRYLYWGNLGDAYRWAPGYKAKAQGAYGRAIQLLREQLAAEPDDPDMRIRLALYLAKSGDIAAAREVAAAFERQPPASAAQLFRLTVTFEIAGDRATALRMLERALAKGYAEKEVRGEPELIELRNDVRYHKLVASIPDPRSP
jgi:serine/threonine-protein kinase